MAGVFEKIDKIKPAFDITYKIVLFACKILLIIDILITTMSVIGRYVSFVPDPAWSEEVVLTCMAYMAVLAVVMITVGWKYARGLGAKGTYVSMPWLSRFWMYFPVPVAGVAMVVFELETLYSHVRSIFIKEEGEA